MKIIKVYDETHTAVKVKAAQTGQTTTIVASSLLNLALRLVESGKAKLPEPETSAKKGE